VSGGKRRRQAKRLEIFQFFTNNAFWAGKIYATLTLNGFDDQERNLMFEKTDFPSLKTQVHVCDMK